MTKPTDPTAVVKVARDLREIESLHTKLLAQAVSKATDREMPGGDAMVMLGPVANLEAWQNLADHQLEQWVESGKPKEAEPFTDTDEDWEPPLQTLLFWSEQWRLERDASIDLRPTITTEAGFLRVSLDWAWEREPHWEDFAADVRKARVRIENTLRAGHRPRRTRVDCINAECVKKPRLILVYGETVEQDGYRCPSCRAPYTHAQFINARRAALTGEGAGRFVKLQDARDAIDRPERTFRKWMSECRILAYCDVVTRSVYCWWPDVRELDVSTPRRKRAA